MVHGQKGRSETPSQRQLRVGEEIRRVVAKMLMADNLFISGLKASYIMITEVAVSADFSFAVIYVQGVGDVNTDNQIMLLNKHKGAFRYQIGKSVRLRIVPEIVFRSDSGFESSQYIDSLLNTPRVQADLAKKEDLPGSLKVLSDKD